MTTLHPRSFLQESHLVNCSSVIGCQPDKRQDVFPIVPAVKYRQSKVMLLVKRLLAIQHNILNNRQLIQKQRLVAICGVAGANHSLGPAIF